MEIVVEELEEVSPKHPCTPVYCGIWDGCGTFPIICV
jgi:hypothetical protein